MSRFLIDCAGSERVVELLREEPTWGAESPQEPDAQGFLRGAALWWRMEAERARAVPSVAESYLRLRAWRRCDAFALAVHRAAGELRGEGACQLAARLLDVARSAHVYVVEGCGRRMRRDCLFFLRRAETLLEEAIHLLDTARHHGCLARDRVEELLALHLDAIRALDGLIASLAALGS